jgi:hypothetical protein
MKTLLSTIYLSTNALSTDRFSIGLIMADNDTLYFNYSDEKLTKLKHLFSNEAFLLIKQYLKSLYKAFNTTEKNKLLRTWVNESYLSYLEKYTNNLVRFGETTNVDIPLNEEVFKKFFQLYVFHYPVATDKEKSTDILKKPQTVTFYKNVAQMVNIEREITSADIENLLIATKVSFIGKNKVTTAGNILNLQRSIQNVGNNINSFISLTKVLDEHQKNKGVYYLIGEEPDKSLKENHHLWSELRKTSMFRYVELPEIDEVVHYFTDHQVTPFFAQ